LRADARDIKGAAERDRRVLRGVAFYADESCGKRRFIQRGLGANLRKNKAQTLRRVLQNISAKSDGVGSRFPIFLTLKGSRRISAPTFAVWTRGKGCYGCKTPVRRAICSGRRVFCPRCQPSPRGFAALPLAGKTESERPKRKDAEDAEKSETKWEIPVRAQSPLNENHDDETKSEARKSKGTSPESWPHGRAGNECNWARGDDEFFQ